MANYVPLSRAFYNQTADVVAARLLGQLLLRRTPSGLSGGMIVETEAYVTGDAAAHGYRGETPRNSVMFGPPGYCYVYFIYGNHWCVNAVCMQPGIPEAVLIRAIEPAFGLEFMQAHRSVTDPRQLTNGPGKLCAAMQINRRHNGLDLCSSESELFIARNPKLKNFLRERGQIVTTTRIGITQAAALPLRFYLDGSLYISRRVKKITDKPVTISKVPKRT